jgi:hypothetical protein
MGVSPPDRWQRIVGHASQLGRVMNLDLDRFPRDITTYLTFQEALREIPSRQAIPAPMPLAELDAFFGEAGERYPVRWLAEG